MSLACQTRRSECKGISVPRRNRDSGYKLAIFYFFTSTVFVCSFVAMFVPTISLHGSEDDGEGGGRPAFVTFLRPPPPHPQLHTLLLDGDSHRAISLVGPERNPSSESRRLRVFGD